MELLRTERSTFARMLPQLLASARGKYAVVVGNKLVGTFDDHRTGFREGLKVAGPDRAFLVQEIREHQELMDAPALVLGLIDPTLP